jgi:hypothetical protein
LSNQSQEPVVPPVVIEPEPVIVPPVVIVPAPVIVPPVIVPPVITATPVIIPLLPDTGLMDSTTTSKNILMFSSIIMLLI